MGRLSDAVMASASLLLIGWVEPPRRGIAAMSILSQCCKLLGEARGCSKSYELFAAQIARLVAAVKFANPEEGEKR